MSASSSVSAGTSSLVERPSNGTNSPQVQEPITSVATQALEKKRKSEGDIPDSKRLCFTNEAQKTPDGKVLHWCQVYTETSPFLHRLIEVGLIPAGDLTPLTNLIQPPAKDKDMVSYNACVSWWTSMVVNLCEILTAFSEAISNIDEKKRIQELREKKICVVKDFDESTQTLVDIYRKCILEDFQAILNNTAKQRKPIPKNIALHLGKETHLCLNSLYDLSTFVSNRSKFFAEPAFARPLQMLVDRSWQQQFPHFLSILDFQSDLKSCSKIYKIIGIDKFSLADSSLFDTKKEIVRNGLQILAAINLETHAFEFTHQDRILLNGVLRLRDIHTPPEKSFHHDKPCYSKCFHEWIEVYLTSGLIDEPQNRANLITIIDKLELHAQRHYANTSRLLQELNACKDLRKILQQDLSGNPSVVEYTLKFDGDAEKKLSKDELRVLCEETDAFKILSQPQLTDNQVKEMTLPCTLEQFETFFHILVHGNENILNSYKEQKWKEEDILNKLTELFPVIAIADKYFCQNVLKSCLDLISKYFGVRPVEKFLKYIAKAFEALKFSETLSENWQQMCDEIFSRRMNTTTSKKEFKNCFEKILAYDQSAQNEWQKVKCVTLSRNIYKYRIQAFAKFSHLKELVFDRIESTIGPRVFEPLRLFSQLSFITFQGCEFISDAIFVYCPSLHTVRFRNSNPAHALKYKEMDVFKRNPPEESSISINLFSQLPQQEITFIQNTLRGCYSFVQRIDFTV